jgi:hypothetical protein
MRRSQQKLPREILKLLSAADQGSVEALHGKLLYMSLPPAHGSKSHPSETDPALLATHYARPPTDLGNVYFFGGEGLPRSESKAAEFYRRASDAGSLESRFRLALMYKEGKGVSKSMDEAVKVNICTCLPNPSMKFTHPTCNTKRNETKRNETKRNEHNARCARSTAIAQFRSPEIRSRADPSCGHVRGG